MKTLRVILLFLVASVLFQVAVAGGDPLSQWREVQMTGSVPNLQTIRYGQGKFLGLQRLWSPDYSTHITLAESTNGRDWTVQAAFAPADRVTDLLFADGLWILVGTRQSTNVLVLTSTNAVNWSSPKLPRGAGAPASSWRIRRSPTEWVLMPGAMDFFFRSTDGHNWTSSPLINPPITTQLSSNGIVDISYCDGRWVAAVNVYIPHDDPLKADTAGQLAVSTNLTDWQWLPSSRRASGVLFYSLNYAHGLWFGVIGPSYSFEGCPNDSECFTYPGPSITTTIITSTDGANWKPTTSLGLVAPVILTDNRFFAVSWKTSYGSIIPEPRAFESDPILSLLQSRRGEVTLVRAAGIPAVVESTEDLRHWKTLANLPVGQAVQPLTDPAASGLPIRFYRARTP